MVKLAFYDGDKLVLLWHYTLKGRAVSNLFLCVWVYDLYTLVYPFRVREQGMEITAQKGIIPPDKCLFQCLFEGIFKLGIELSHLRMHVKLYHIFLIGL